MKEKCYVDVETTGLDPKTDEVIQIAICDSAANWELCTYVRPLRHASWEEAQLINGISPEMVKDAPTLDSLENELRSIFRDRIFAAYNAQFDASFLCRFFENTDIHDVMTRFMSITQKPRMKLTDALNTPEVRQHYPHYRMGKSHNAMEDAWGCMVLDLYCGAAAAKETAAELLSLSEPIGIGSFPDDISAAAEFARSHEFNAILDFIKHGK